MTSRYIYCAICGLPFSSGEISIVAHKDLVRNHYDFAYDDSVITPQQIEWLDYFRIVTTANDDVPADQYAEYHQSILISTPATWEEWPRVFFEPALKLYQVFSLNEDSDPFRMALHDSCLDIITKVARSRNNTKSSSNLPKNLTQFYLAIKQQKFKQRLEQPSLDWDHSYYGASDFWGQAWTARSGWEWLAADPFHVPEITLYVLSKLRPLVSSSIEAANFNPHTLENISSFLEILPAPAIDHILSHLDLSSILSLRRCSSTMYNTIALTPRFWRDRLIEGEAVPWLWDLDADKMKGIDLDQDWTGLVRDFQDYQTAEEIEFHIALKNRKRIWKIVSEIRLSSI